MGMWIKLKEKVLCIFSTASVDVVSEYYSMKQDFGLKPAEMDFCLSEHLSGPKNRVKTVNKSPTRCSYM